MQIRCAMKRITFSDSEKLRALVKSAGLSRSDIARALEVRYKTVYRWIDKGIRPQPAHSRHIDELFKEHVDLTHVVERMRKSMGDPIRTLREDASSRGRFFLEMTYNSLRGRALYRTGRGPLTSQGLSAFHCQKTLSASWHTLSA